MGRAYKKAKGARQNFSNKTLRCTKILFYGRGLNVFSPLRDTNPKTTYYPLSYLFRLNTLQPEGKHRRGRPRETWRRPVNKERGHVGINTWRKAEAATIDKVG